MKTLIIAFVTLLFALIGCDSVVDEHNNFDYSIEQKMDCYCPQGGIWVKLFITADSVSRAIRISDNYKLGYNEFRYYKSIKDLYNEISETDTNTYTLIVSYDSQNNYPTFLYKEPKPIVVDDSTTIITVDAQLSYTSQNYIKLK